MLNTLKLWIQSRSSSVRRKLGTVHVQLEQLESRYCPSGGILPPGQGQKAATWDPDANPANKGNPNPNHNYSVAANWSTGHVPIGYLQAIFDGGVDNASCVIDIDPANNTGGPIIQLQDGYTAQFTIQGGINCQINSYFDGNPATDSFNVAFGNNALLTFMGQASSALYNLSFTGVASPTTGVTITAGSVQAYTQGTETTQVPINVNGGTLLLQPTSSLVDAFFQLQNNAYIAVQGTSSSLIMNDLGSTQTFVSGDGANFKGNGTTQDIEISKGAEATINIGAGCWDNINVPIFNDSSTVQFIGAGNASDPSRIFIYQESDKSPNFSYTETSTTGYAWTYLSGGVTVTADDGYQQATSSSYYCYLQTSDSLTESLIAPNGGNIFIGNNTKIRIDPFDPNGGFGNLWLYGNVSMFGELDVEIYGLSGGSGHESLLNIFGDMTWLPGSSISVLLPRHVRFSHIHIGSILD